jgi:hypothetical protein
MALCISGLLELRVFVGVDTHEGAGRTPFVGRKNRLNQITKLAANFVSDCGQLSPKLFRELRRELCGCVRKCIADAASQPLHRYDREQADEHNEQAVLNEVLSFFFLPQTLHNVHFRVLFL